MKFIERTWFFHEKLPNNLGVFTFPTLEICMDSEGSSKVQMMSSPFIDVGRSLNLVTPCGILFFPLFLIPSDRQLRKNLLSLCSLFVVLFPTFFLQTVLFCITAFTQTHNGLALKRYRFSIRFKSWMRELFPIL